MVYLNILPKLSLIFGCHKQKMQKLWHLRQLNDHNSGSEHDNKINDPISRLLFELYPFAYFISAFQDLHTSLHYILVCKIDAYMPKMLISSLLT